MKKIALFLLVALLLMSIAGCDRQPEDTTLATDPEKLYITNDEVDLRQKVVDYMYAMANIKWTAGILLDYSNYSATLVYEPGKT
jgi:hypothetical protein